MSVPNENIVHSKVHGYIRACHGDEREECSLLDIMSPKFSVGPH